MGKTIHDLSDEAIKMWFCHFAAQKRATLRFGGDHAKMEITPWARDALNDLLAVGAVAPTEPDDSWPNREHYRGTDIDLRSIAIERAGEGQNALYKWLFESGGLVTFRKKTHEGE